VGLDSSEVGHPPSKFARVFARPASAGLKLVAHAGEEGPPDYVWEALDILDVDRIDHGNRALEDPALVKRWCRGHDPDRLPALEPQALRGRRPEGHPLKTMLDLGLKATINSDDPAYFGGYLGQNWTQTAEALDLSRDDLVTLAKNSFTGSFLPPDRVAGHLAEIDAYVASQAK
jgi:adenosine deaminase